MALDKNREISWKKNPKISKMKTKLPLLWFYFFKSEDFLLPHFYKYIGFHCSAIGYAFADWSTALYADIRWFIPSTRLHNRGWWGRLTKLCIVNTTEINVSRDGGTYRTIPRSVHLLPWWTWRIFEQLFCIQIQLQISGGSLSIADVF